MTDSAAAPEPSLSMSALRMRLLRDRRRKGLRCVVLEVRESELDQLIARHLLQEADRDDPMEVSRALGRWLDRSLR